MEQKANIIKLIKEEGRITNISQDLDLFEIIGKYLTECSIEDCETRLDNAYYTSDYDKNGVIEEHVHGILFNEYLVHTVLGADDNYTVLGIVEISESVRKAIIDQMEKIIDIRSEMFKREKLLMEFYRVDECISTRYC